MVKELYFKSKKINMKAGWLMNTFSAFVAIYLSLNTFNLYAADVDDYKWKLDSTASVSGSYKMLGLDAGYEGASTATTQTGVAHALATEAILNLAGAEISVNKDQILASSEVPEMHKVGLLGMTERQVNAMFRNQPGVDQVRHFAREWIPGEKLNDRSTYAADDGYSYLTSIGIDSLWEKTRLLAYVMFVVILIAAGFMIMFRHKIGGQMAVTVFNTLPQVVLGLILVTFSFAIVGLILNLAVLLTNVIASFLDSSGDSLIFIQSPFTLVKVLFKPEAWAVGANTVAGWTVGLGTLLIGGLVAATAATGGAALGGFLLVGLIIALAVLGFVAWASIRVYITLLFAYLGIILDTILGPIFLAFSVFPGNQGIAMEWFKRLLKNALVFPGVFLLINLGLYILKNDFNLNFPYSLTGGNFGVGEGGDATALSIVFRSLITLGLFFIAAEVPKLLTDVIKLSGSKGVGDALKGAFGKMPIVGGMFS